MAKIYDNRSRAALQLGDVEDGDWFKLGGHLFKVVAEWSHSKPGYVRVVREEGGILRTLCCTTLVVPVVISITIEE